MGYLDNTGLQTLWNKIKNTFVGSANVSPASTTVDIQLKNKAATPDTLSTATIPAATDSLAGVMTAAEHSKLAGIEAGAKTGTVTSITAGTGLSGGTISTSGTISHSTANGYKHIPADGASGKILGWSSEGTATWIDAPETGVTKIVAGSNVTISPTTGVGNVTINAQDTTYNDFVGSGTSAAHGLVPKPSTTAGTTKYLREDGTWVVPPNTTYTAGTNVSISGNTISATDTTYVFNTAYSATTNKAATMADVPNELSDLTSDSTHRTVTDTEKSTWNNKQNPITFNTTYDASTNKAATMSDINSAVTGAARYQGTLATEAAFTALTNYKTGYYWVASASFIHTTSGGTTITIETGNMIFANADGTTYSASKFDIIQSDIEAIPDSIINALS